MRARTEGDVLTLRAIAGLHVVILAWDFREGQDARKEGLLGFAIERSELDGAGAVVERYMLRGIKRFEFKDRGLPPGTLVPLDEHPVQAFQWGDYTVKPGVTYIYRLVPLYGKPKLITPADDVAVAVTVTTESEIGAGTEVADGASRQDVYFNRGVIGSQAYARQFPGEVPDPDKPASPPMRWLSRGLFEALLAFIAKAGNERFALRAAFYELHYTPVLTAFRKAFDACQDVRIVFDAESSYKKGNIAALAAAGLDDPGIAVPRTVTEGIRHNKFIVLLEKKGNTKVPVAVWTGSTNISAGGIFGHANVGHVVWNRAVAQAYLDYWTRLAENKTPRKLRAPNREATPTPDGPPPPGVTALFSPRDDDGDPATLRWYAERMADAKRIVCITIAFNLDPLFQEVIARENDVLRYIVKDDDLADGEVVGRDRDVIFAAGGRLEGGALTNFLKEHDNPLNRNDYIHTKFMLVDPLGDDPLVVTGSANFSRPSQEKNDENMLVIRGDTRVADIYLGEFMRIFDHHYARYIVRKLSASGAERRSGFLKEKTEAWLPSHFDDSSYKAKRRRYFAE